MSGRSSGRVSCKPYTKEKTRTSHKQNAKRVSGENKGFTTSSKIRMPTSSELSPLRFLGCIGDKVATALRCMPIRRRRRRSSPNASSLERSNPSIAPLDTYRAEAAFRGEAIKDCIEYIKSCSI